MGITMSNVHIMEQYGLLGAGRNLLDFGSSNLYAATQSEIINFVRRHNAAPRPDLESWAEKLAAGSGKDASGSALNKSFFGELIEAIGMGYTAIDIAVGYKTTVVDLNASELPEDMVGAFDSVINFGTSEHILNQMNVFAAVHAATKAGGLIMHSVPSIGFVDHGYFCYTSRFFFDLAGYNQYDVVDMWYDGPAGEENMFSSARQYQTYFPVLTNRLAKIGTTERETMQDRIKVPVIALALVYRKNLDKPFMGTVETSTSVGTVLAEVLGSYRTGKSILGPATFSWLKLTRRLGRAGLRAIRRPTSP